MPAVSKTKPKTAKDPTRALFEDLAARGHEPLLKDASGTLRFDLVDGRRVEQWYVSVDQGDVTVSHEKAAADTVLRTDRTLFDQIASGRRNAMAATLRGELVPEGNLSLLMVFQRLFPGPPRSRARRRTDVRQRSSR
jgi:putative sterol carrier protein